MPEFALLLDALENAATALPKLVHPLRYLTGALFALTEARRRATPGFPADHEPELLDVVRMLRRSEPLPEPYLAGYYQNDAMARIDACHERLLKAILAAKGSPPKDRIGKRSKTDWLAWQIQADGVVKLPARGALEKIRVQMNEQKHEVPGRKSAHLPGAPTDADIEEALFELLGIMEAEGVRALLAQHFR